MFRGLKQPIPKHIYAQAKAARLGRPDFYVGPTVPKTPPDRKPGDSSGGRDPGIEDHMNKLRDEDRRAARELTREVKKAAAEKKASERDSGAGLQSVVKLLQRFSFRRVRGERQPNASI